MGARGGLFFGFERGGLPSLYVSSAPRLWGSWEWRYSSLGMLISMPLIWAV